MCQVTALESDVSWIKNVIHWNVKLLFENEFIVSYLPKILIEMRLILSNIDFTKSRKLCFIVTKFGFFFLMTKNINIVKFTLNI